LNSPQAGPSRLTGPAPTRLEDELWSLAARLSLEDLEAMETRATRSRISDADLALSIFAQEAKSSRMINEDRAIAQRMHEEETAGSTWWLPTVNAAAGPSRPLLSRSPTAPTRPTHPPVLRPVTTAQPAIPPRPAAQRDPEVANPPESPGLGFGGWFTSILGALFSPAEPTDPSRSSSLK
jgi:hypothetical protein